MLSIPIVYDNTQYSNYKNRHLFIKNLLDDIKRPLTRERDELLHNAAVQFSNHGHFHNIDWLLGKQAQIDQIDYILYGDENGQVRNIVPDDSLSGEDWYRDILLKFDPTILMSDGEKKEHNIRIMEWLDSTGWIEY